MLAAPEVLDIYTDQHVHVGTAEMQVAHHFGLWHSVFSALVVNPSSRTCVLQVKAPGRHDFQREFEIDFSVGGHLLAGEPVSAGVREVREEIGLLVDDADLIPVGLRQTSATLAVNYVERAFQHWHLLAADQPIADYRPEDDEVASLAEIDLVDARRVATGELDSVEAVLLSRTPEDGWATSAVKVTRDAFVRNYLRVDEIFPRMFIAAEQLLAGAHRVYW